MEKYRKFLSFVLILSLIVRYFMQFQKEQSFNRRMENINYHQLGKNMSH